MSGKPGRFGGFLQPAVTAGEREAEVAVEEIPASSAGLTLTPEPYLLRRFAREEAVARLGNGVRAATKHRLEDYVRELKRGGWPATEARVMEGMFELLDEDPDFRNRVTVYLTGKA
jgi:hypothetical protein